MKVTFWGVRGSLPAPITPQQVQSKIMAAIQRATPADLENSETRSKFISNLPSWIFGTTGGNTACVELTHNNTNIILDAGTGLRVLGKSRKCPDTYHMFFSHLHWDHIQGFPFFDHAFNPECSFEMYHPSSEAEQFFYNQMTEPYSPPSVPKSITKKIHFNTPTPDQEFYVDGIEVCCHKMSHPGDSYAYSFKVDGKKFVYATDVELRTSDYDDPTYGEKVFKDADAIVIDSQYTVEELFRKENWGHSAFCFAIDFAYFWNIKKVYMFHHDPTYDDKKLNSILQAARWYAQNINHCNIEIYLAKESQEIKI